MNFWDALFSLPTLALLFFCLSLFVAFGFEFINGFHDTANAVTTVIYTRTLQPTPAVVFSGFMNFLGVLVGGTAIAFGIVNLLPVDLLVKANSNAALGMVMSLLMSGVFWNLSTWYLGMPVSSSHTLIGSILGVGLAHSLIENGNVSGVNWAKAGEVGLALLVSPLFGFMAAGLLLLAMKAVIRAPKLYKPPEGDDRPPGWIRGVLITTCGGVSFAHGSNDGQKGMGLLLLVLIGFMPFQYSLNSSSPERLTAVVSALPQVRESLEKDGKLTPGREKDLAYLKEKLADAKSFSDVPSDDRWEVRQAIFRLVKKLPKEDPSVKALTGAVEFVPLWVKIGTAFALGIGTMVGYKRIVVTIAEKIGKTHLTYGQGAVAETVAAATIILADTLHAPVSTTHILSSGVAGTMVANKSGVQMSTIRRIALAWLFTLPATMLLSGILFTLGRLVVK